MQHIDNLPAELCCHPEPLIVLSGLDTETNSVHRSIWRGFTTGRGRDHDSFKFLSLPIDHQFPKPKLKPPGSYDWFLPKGILKTGWMRKHLEQIPAVVAVFFDLDWSERQWEEKSVECAQRVDIVRSKLAGRESKLVVILIQKRAPLPLGDDTNAMERAQALCTKCELPGKNLFVLSPTNLLYGCITRLESEFRDMAVNYYHERAKRVKAHKDSLNKTSHQLLFVRHEFKIAFFGELKQDPALALKHYSQAYNHLLEQRMVDIHMLEFKTVAGFINYKICRLSFQTNASDAISQFRNHIDFFSGLTGMPQLAFEHEAWMSKQFEILGDLFQEAIRSSLIALMTQHPGFYYQEAARHTIARRQLCHRLCSTTHPTLDPDPLMALAKLDTVDLSPNDVTGTLPTSPHSHVGTEPTEFKHFNVISPADVVRAQSPLRFPRRSVDSSPTSPTAQSPSSACAMMDLSTYISATEKVGGLEFYGQRPWRQGIQSMEPPNAAKEQEGIRLLQKAELAVDHSELIIPLLEHAHFHYKRYKADRMKLYPLVLMGWEYYLKGNYEKALNCYSGVLDDYRREKWWSLYTFVLQHILRCAYLTGKVEAFLSAGLELIGPNSLLDSSTKTNVQHALFDLLQCNVPDPLSFMSAVDVTTLDPVTELWQLALSPRPFAPLSNSPKPDDSSSPQVLTPNTANTTSTRDVVLDVSQLRVCIECKVAFTRSRNTIDRPVQLAVFLRSHAPLPFEISQLSVDLTHKTKRTVEFDQSGQSKAVSQSSQTWSKPFILEPSDVAKVVLFCVDPHRLCDYIRIDAVYLELSYSTQPSISMESGNKIRVLLSWHWSASDHSSPFVGPHSPTKSEYANSPTGGWSNLWDLSHISSALQYQYQRETISLPHPADCSEITVPAFPPTWDLVLSQLDAVICERNAALEVTLEHTPPALARDIYTVRCHVVNQESVEASHINLFVHLTEQSAERGVVAPAVASYATSPDSISTPTHDGDLIKIGEMPTSSAAPYSPSSRVGRASDVSPLSSLTPNAHSSWPLMIICSKPGTRSLHCQFTYETRLPNPVVPDYLLVLERHPTVSGLCQSRLLHVDDRAVEQSNLKKQDGEDDGIMYYCVKNTTTEINVLVPFQLSWKLTTIHQLPISDLIVDEHFLLHLGLTNKSPFDLEVISTDIQLSPTLMFADGEQDCQIRDICFHSHGLLCECQLLVVSRANQENEVIDLGHYAVRWRRRLSGSELLSDHVVTTLFPLFSCPVLDLPLRLRAELPATGTLLTPMSVIFRLDNRTIYPQEVLIQLDSTPDFMFSGPNKVRLRVLPESPQLLHHTFLPLRTGYLTLPRFHLLLTKINRFTTEDQNTLKLLIEEKILRGIATHIFVVPSDKNESTTPPQNCTLTGHLVPTV